MEMSSKHRSESGDAVMIVRADGEIVERDRRAAALLETAGRSLVGANVLTLSPENQPNGASSRRQWETTLETVCREGAASLEWAFSGTEKPVFIELEASRLPGGPFFLLKIHASFHSDDEKKRLEETVAKFQALFENANDAIVILDELGVCVECNGKALEIYGAKDKRELIGCAPKDYSPDRQANGETSKEKAQRLNQDAFRGERRRFEWLNKRRDGSEFLAEISLAPVESSEGKLLFTIIRDITESRRAERLLRESERELREYVDDMTIFSAKISPDGKMMWANKAMLDAIGVTLGDIVGIPAERCPWWNYDERVVARARRLIRQALAGERTLYEEKVRIRGGRYRDVACSLVPARDADGRLKYLLAEGVDITERKLVEEELKATRSYLDNVVNSMPSVLIGVTVEGQVYTMNREAERFCGLANREASGRPLGEVFPYFEEYEAEIRQAIRERSCFESRQVSRNLGGRRAIFNLTSYPLITNGVKGAVLRADDITARVMLEEAMAQTEKMSLIGGLAAGMAHEINNPLGIILQGAENAVRRFAVDLPVNRQVADQLGIDFDKLQAYLEQRRILGFLTDIREAANRASIIVRDLLRFSRKSENKMALCDAENLFRSTINLAANDYDLKKEYDFRHIAVHFEIGPDLPRIPCVESEIKQVLLNLLRNAAQAMFAKRYPENVRPMIVLRAKRQAEMVVIEVEDNGPGMDDATRQRVFEPFFTTKEPGGGTGLGLSVSYFIVKEKHGGEIVVDSRPGEGTKFSLRLPLLQLSMG